MIQRLCTLYFARKRLILLKKSDLSTEKTAFTITTIFIYRSIVNRQKKRKSGDIFKKHAKSISKKKPPATARPTAKPSSRKYLDADVRERTALLIAQLWLPDNDQCTQTPSNMSLQQEKTRFLLAVVDKCLHIHRMRCGKSRSLSTSQFLSQTSPP